MRNANIISTAVQRYSTYSTCTSIEPGGGDADRGDGEHKYFSATIIFISPVE